MGILANLYESRHGPDARSVLSGNLKGVCVINADGPFDPSVEYPAVRIIGNGPGMCRAVPCEAADQGKWLRFGGRYIAVSDSRLSACAERACDGPFYGAVALHDRYEG